MTDRIGASFTSPATSFYMEADHISTDTANGRWLVRFKLRAVNGPNGSTGSQYNGAGNQVGYVNGGEFGRHSGNPFLPAGFQNGAFRWNDGPWDLWIYNNRNAWNLPLSMYVQYGNVNWTGTGSIYLPQIANIPNQPGTPSATNVQPTEMTLNWSIPANNGSAIDQMLLRVWKDAATSGPYTDVPLGGNVTSHRYINLTPGTDYYWAVYAHNGVGYSARSNVLKQSTLPATAPGLMVTPSISGSSATAIFTPPGGATGVTKYVLERRILGGGALPTVETATSPLLLQSLTPGTSYEYRASAFFGSYQSPWTDWQAAVQPNPNTDPGGYFDGSTPDTPVLDYGWTGAAGLSTTQANGLAPVGWRTFAQAAAASGGTGAVFRALGGFQGAFAARALFFTDATAYGFAFGTADAPLTALADIEANATYFGSVYAWPSRSNRLRAVIRWYNSAGAYLSSTVGSEEVVPADKFTRLVASGNAPATASYASVVVENVAGTDGSLWRGGDWLHLDAAMVSLQQIFDYFDGATPDSGQFSYSWLGAENASASIRQAAPEGQAIDPFLDPDCPPIPGAPRPPKIDESCIDEVGTWRRYWAVIPEEEVYDRLSVVPTTEITTGGYAARQVRVRYYANPENLQPGPGMNLPAESEQVISYIPATSAVVLDGVSESAWGFQLSNPDDATPVGHLLYGTDGGPASWPVLSCGGPYLISFDVPLDAPEGNISVGVSLTPRMT